MAIADFAFTPPELAVRVGAAVTFRNDDDFDHQVRLAATGETGPRLGPHETWSYIPAQAGEIAYYCNIHNSMKGTLRAS